MCRRVDTDPENIEADMRAQPDVPGSLPAELVVTGPTPGRLEAALWGLSVRDLSSEGVASAHVVKPA
jgi:hypothetical protein